MGQQGVRVLLVVSEEPAVALQPLLVNHLISFFEPDILGPHIPNGGKRVSGEDAVLVAIVAIVLI